MNLSLPPLAEREVQLAATSRRAANPEAPAPPAATLAGRVKLGGPFAVLVTPEYVASSPDLCAFVEQEAAHSLYHLVHISVSFESGEAEAPLATAALDIALKSPGASRRPVAWSMSPMQITDPAEVTSSLTVGPQLKLGGIELAGIGRTRTRVHRENDIFLQAFRELRADPGWRLQRTSAMALLGCFRFCLIVRSEIGATTELALTIAATVFRRNWLRSYSYSLLDPLSMSATL
jgi:hypothetical protein